MAGEADVSRKLTWHAGPAQMQRDTKATWQGRAWPTRGAGGADTWRGHVAGGHAGPRGSMRTPVRGATWQGGLANEGPTG